MMVSKLPETRLEPRGHIIEIVRTPTLLGPRLIITIRTDEMYRTQGVAYGVDAEVLVEALQEGDFVEFQGYCHEGIWRLVEVCLLRRQEEP